MLDKSKIREHKSLKEKFPSYPRLPLFILKAGTKGYKKPNAGLQESCMRGFRQRLNNWERHQSYLDN